MNPSFLAGYQAALESDEVKGLVALFKELKSREDRKQEFDCGICIMLDTWCKACGAKGYLAKLEKARGGK